MCHQRGYIAALVALIYRLDNWRYLTIEQTDGADPAAKANMADASSYYRTGDYIKRPPKIRK